MLSPFPTSFASGLLKFRFGGMELREGLDGAFYTLRLLQNEDKIKIRLNLKFDNGFILESLEIPTICCLIISKLRKTISKEMYKEQATP